MTDTIESRTGQVWPDAGPESTSLIQRCTAARRVPIDRLTAEHLRVLLGQSVDPDVVVPVAVGRLAADPMMGDYYEGDVLEAALGLPAEVWRHHAAERSRLEVVVRELTTSDEHDVDDELVGLIDTFIGT